MGRHFKEQQRRRLTKLRAILAGGLVLGIGAATTLAAWVDNEYAQANFSASVFRTESSLDSGATWQERDLSPGGTLVFSTSGVPGAGPGLSPGAVRYASLWVRTRPASLGGTAALLAPVINDPDQMALHLRVRVAQYTGTTCDTNTFTSPSRWILGPAVSPIVTAGATTSPLPANQTGDVRLCFEVSMLGTAPTSLQGKSISLVWDVQGTSSD